jgi:hypothetical protein
MEAYNSGSHTVWDFKYHLVWVTKYRYPVLGGDVGVRCRELLQESAEWRTDPALSRNLKPPPLGGGAFTEVVSLIGPIPTSRHVGFCAAVGEVADVDRGFSARP